MPGSTTNYAFNLPLVNDPIDADLWGGQLNANWTSLDTLLAAAGLKSTGFDDSAFRISDNADATKKLAFEVSGISAGTTRTITVTDRSLAIPANAAGPSSLVLAEDTDNGANTATLTAPAALAANRTYTLPDEDGTVVTTARVSSETVQGLVELATTAEVRGASDATRAITPLSVAQHPAMPKAWGVVGSTGTLLSNYGVSSITKGGTGVYTINFTNAFTDANYSVVVMCRDPNVGVANEDSTFTKTTTSCRIVINLGSGGVIDRQFNFVAFGTWA